MRSPWIEVRIAIQRLDGQDRDGLERGILEPLLAVAEMTWAEPMRHLKIQGKREGSSVLTSS